VVTFLLLPALARGDTTKFDTAVSVRVDDDNQALDAAFKDQLATKQGTRVDACWHKAGRLHAKVGFDDGKVSSVEIDQLDDKAATACITKTLKAIVLANVHGHSVADVGLEATDHSNRKKLDAIIDRNLSTNLSKFSGIKGDNTTSNYGTGVGTAPAGGTGTTRRSGGGGTAEGDFVAKAPNPAVPPTTVAVGPLDASSPPADGELTADEINRVIRSRAGVFRACYQKELDKSPKLGGKVVMRITIKPDGTVGNVAVASSTLKSDAVEACLKSNIMRLKFPAKSQAVVNYPFVFAAS